MMMTLKYENNGAQQSSANICCCRRRQSAIIYSDVWISHCIAISRFSYFRCTIHSFLALSHHLVFPFFFSKSTESSIHHLSVVIILLLYENVQYAHCTWAFMFTFISTNLVIYAKGIFLFASSFLNSISF